MFNFKAMGTEFYDYSIFLVAGYDYRIATSIPFIPVASAIATKSYSQIQPSDFLSYTKSSMGFGSNIYFERNSMDHAFFTKDAVMWIKSQVEFGIYGSRHCVAPEQFNVPNHPNVQWSVSNPEIASISSTGVLTPKGDRVIEIIAMDIATGHKTSKRVIVGRPRFRLRTSEKLPGGKTIFAEIVNDAFKDIDLEKDFPHLMEFVWGIKFDGHTIHWDSSYEKQINIPTMPNGKKVTVYLKVKYEDGYESAPLQIKASDEDIYNLTFNSFNITENGVITSDGREIDIKRRSMYIERIPGIDYKFQKPEWSPQYYVIITPTRVARGEWKGRLTLDNFFSPQDISYLTDMQNKGKVAVYTFLLYNNRKLLIQVSNIPITIN